MEDRHVVQFSGGVSLVLYRSRHDAFAYWTTESSGAKAGQRLWQQLEKAELIRSGIAENDRILRFDLRLRDIYQNRMDFALIFECITPNPNLILCRVEGGQLRIVDACQQYSLADNPQRQILPGLIYHPPQTSYQPAPEQNDGLLTIETDSESRTYDDVNQYLADYYDLVIVNRERTELRQRLIREWSRLHDRIQRKIAAQTNELTVARDAEKWYQYAEIIKYNLSDINKGQTELVSVNYFAPEAPPVSIPLEPTLDAVRNMQRYIKQFHKARNGAAIIARNLAGSEAAAETVKGIIRRIEAGEIIYPETKGGKPQTGHSIGKLDKLLRLKIDQDWEIVIGRKASENDLVSTELGRPHDWWFHTRIYRGAHVLLRNFARKEPPEHLIEMCCGLAAYYSKAKFSQNVPVDYTQVRYVRKPRRSPTGFVTYTNHHTVFAQPLDLRSAKAQLSNER